MLGQCKVWMDMDMFFSKGENEMGDDEGILLEVVREENE